MSSIAALGHRLAAGELSAVELTRDHLDRIERQNPTLNCYLKVLPEAALAQAAASDERRRRGASLGPLDGIPLGLKDNIDLAGVPTTAGMAARHDAVAGADAACVARLRAAGAVFLGKHNMEEGAFGAVNDNPHFGRAHNPARHGHTPGGSSGGSAAAVAAGLGLAALGTDTMGSVRLPAAYCGVLGMIPTHGAIAADGVVPLCRQLDQVGVLARSAADMVLLLGALADLPAAPPPPVAGMRIGLASGLAVGVDPEVKEACGIAAERLRSVGCRLVDVPLSDYAPDTVRRAGLLLVEAEAWTIFAEVIRTRPEGISPRLVEAFRYGRDAAPERLARAAATLAAVQPIAARVFADCDVLMTPTAPTTAFPFGTPTPDDQANLTAIANVCGLPAISLPAGSSDDGLPIGVQLIAPRRQDARLLALAARLG